MTRSLSPPGRRPASCPCIRATTARSAAATPPTAARSSSPRTGPQPGSRVIGVKVIRIKARSAHPARARLPAPGRAGRNQHDVQVGEQARRPPRRRARRLPGHRQLRSARLPRGPVRAEALHRLSRREVVPCLHPRLARLRRSAPGGRRRSRRLHAATAGRRSRGRPPGAGLQAHRPGQRERRHAARDDLRLALTRAASTAR